MPKAAERRVVEVCADWQALGSPTRIGWLYADLTRGIEVSSFEHDPAWLDAGHVEILDPALRPLPGVQFTRERSSFGMVLDASPDRWGRVLMQRREALLARESKRAERRLTELDYLLGVYDGHRMGALRFRLPGGAFLDDNMALASPPWTSLRELEHASLQLEREGAERDRRYGTWLQLLLAPGRSLGGARPKASVLDPRGQLWIAKFPSANDPEDVGAWEHVVHRLAIRAGITTSNAKLQRFASRHHTFLSRRFDRPSPGHRIHFASAMTLVERDDGEGASYLDIVRALSRYGAHPARDLEELWRRIVFFVCVSNVDDHLRNHGFLLEPAGWSLAPAYDMNPVAYGNGLTLNISETDNTQELELVRDVAKHFRVKPKRATEIIARVVAAVRQWKAEAKRVTLSRAAQDRMAAAFRLVETR